MKFLIRATFNSILVIASVLCTGIININAQQKKPSAKFKVIAFYTANEDEAHISFVHDANHWFPQMGKKYNFTYDSTKDWNNLNANFLSRYQVVLFLDTRPENPAQRAAFKKYMENGGG